MNKKKILTITAPTCSGKSTVETELASRGFGKVISHTTRKPRTGEVHGNAYYFTDAKFFNDPDFVEKIEFNGHIYGIHGSTVDALLNSAHTNLVIVAEPNGVQQIQNWCRTRGIECVSIFLHVPEFVRFQRFLRRFSQESNDAVEANARRLCAMVEESSWFSTWAFKLNFVSLVCDSDETPQQIADRIEKLIL